MENKTGLEMLALVCKAMGITGEMLFDEGPGYMEVSCALDDNIEPKLTLYYGGGKRRTITRCSYGFEFSGTPGKEDTEE